MATRSRQSTVQPTPRSSRVGGSQVSRQSTVQPTPRSSRVAGSHVSRQSTEQPTPQALRAEASQIPPPSTNTEPPSYEPPSFSLNPAAQHALAHLEQTLKLKKLTDSIETAQKNVTEAADEINHRLTQKRQRLENHKSKAQKRREQDESLEDDEVVATRLEKAYDETEKNATSYTNRMEETMRRLIDAQEYIRLTKESLHLTAEDARNNASTQATQQQRRSTRRAGREDGDGEDEESDSDDIPEFEPTDPAAGTQILEPTMDVFKKKYEQGKRRYQEYSLFDRYSENPAYENYRKSVHAAAYPNESAPMPPKHTWFDENGTVAPVGYTKRPDGNNPDDSDDDLAVSRANISTKCPLTLKEFENPITSKNCDHSFETSAIMDMLRNSTHHLPAQPGKRAVKAVQCPVASCSQMLTQADLQPNEFVIKQIKRQQQAKAQALLEERERDEEGSESGSQGSAQRIDSDDEDDENEDETENSMDIDEGSPNGAKTEPRSTGAPETLSLDDT